MGQASTCGIGGQTGELAGPFCGRLVTKVGSLATGTDGDDFCDEGESGLRLVRPGHAEGASHQLTMRQLLTWIKNGHPVVPLAHALGQETTTLCEVVVKDVYHRQTSWAQLRARIEDPLQEEVDALRRPVVRQAVTDAKDCIKMGLYNFLLFLALGLPLRLLFRFPFFDSFTLWPCLSFFYSRVLPLFRSPILLPFYPATPPFFQVSLPSIRLRFHSSYHFTSCFVRGFFMTGQARGCFSLITC